MPVFQLLEGRLNCRFTIEPPGEKGPPPISDIDPGLFEPGTNLPDAAEALGVVRTPGERAYIEALPAGIQESIRALIYHDLTRDTPISITFAWAPSYDYELSIWEAPGTSESPGGITLFLKSRYPGDAHPAPPAAS